MTATTVVTTMVLQPLLYLIFRSRMNEEARDVYRLGNGAFGISAIVLGNILATASGALVFLAGLGFSLSALHSGVSLLFNPRYRRALPVTNAQRTLPSH